MRIYLRKIGTDKSKNERSKVALTLGVLSSSVRGHLIYPGKARHAGGEEDCRGGGGDERQARGPVGGAALLTRGWGWG